jgi:pyruvate decarboxylase/indolepyruvate decarboxylase
MTELTTVQGIMPEFTIGNYLATRLEQYVTCAAVRIVHPGDAPSMIDHAIRTALRERKPAYIEIACNLSDAPCPEPGPYEAIMAPEESNSRALAGAVDRATALLAGAKKPILLTGAHLRCSSGAIGAFRDVAEVLGCAVAVMPDAKGFFPEDHRQYIGIYWGSVSSPGCEAVMDWADVILAAGPVFSDYTTVGWTGEPPAEKMINVSARDVRFTDAEYTNVAMADFLAGLAKNVHGNDATLGDQQSTQAQGRPGPDRMPDRARRLQSPAHRMGRKSRPRQHPPAPDQLIHEVMFTAPPGSPI